MAFWYDMGIRAYGLAIGVAAPFNEKAALLRKGRKETRRKAEGMQRGTGRLVWFHAASLGEFEQGRPVIEALKAAEPETKILLTFFSPSGYEIRKNYAGADYILYLPEDTRKNAVWMIEKFRPDAAVFIKYEFWFHYLDELRKRGIPVFLISAVFRSGQPFFKKWGGLHRRMLGCFRELFVQDEQSEKLLASVGVSNVRVVGDTRFDRVKQIADGAKLISKVERFCDGRPAVVCGSTWPPDEEILLEYANRYEGECKWIIAPHEIGESRVEAILGKCRKKAVRYTSEEADFAASDVLIIDCIGLLSSVYRYGEVAYIGGGFGVGIHNTLEAAVYGIPVVFGPNYRKFNEAVGLIRDGGAFSVSDGTQLSGVLDSLLGMPAVAEAAGKKAAAYVADRLGATRVIVEELCALASKEAI